MEFAAINVLIIGGLAAILVPVLIHLFNRTRYLITKWAAMEFLLAAMKKTRRRVRIENLILLLMRIIVLMFAALMLARPSVQGEIPLPKTTHLVVVMDNSYSMTAKVGEQSAFEIAKERVAQAIQADNLRDSDATTLIRTSENLGDYFKKDSAETEVTPEPVDSENPDMETAAADTITEPKPNFELKNVDADVLYSTDKIAVKRKLKESTVIAKEPDWLQTFELVKLALQAPKDRFELKHVVIFTDCQKRNFIQKSQALQDELKTLVTDVTKLTGGIRIQLVDVSKQNVSNCAILSAKLLDTVLGTGVPLRMIVKIGNFSLPRNESQKMNVKLSYSIDGGREHHLKTVNNLSPGETTNLTITEDLQVFDKPGIHAIRLSLQGDNLPIDDNYYLVVDVIKGFNLLVINGAPNPDKPQLSETFNFEIALPRSSKELARRNRNRTHPRTMIFANITPVDAITGIDFFDYDAIILANVKDFEGHIQALERYVKAGNPLIITLGDMINKTYYNEKFYKKGKGLLPGMLESIEGSFETLSPFKLIVDDPTDRSIADMYKEDTSLVEPTKHLIYPNFYVFYKMKPDKSPEIRKILSVSDKDKSPLLIDKKFGRGVVSVFTTTLDRNWNTMPIFATYVAFWHEMIYKVTEVPKQYKKINAGDVYRRPVSPKEFAQNNLIFAPERDIKQITNGIQIGVQNLLSAGREGAFRGELLFKETLTPGIYTVMMLKNKNTLKYLIQKILAATPEISPALRLNLVEILTDKIIEAKENREQAISDILTEKAKMDQISQELAVSLKGKILTSVEEFLSQKEVNQTIDKFAVNLRTDESDLAKLASSEDLINVELQNLFGKENAFEYIPPVKKTKSENVNKIVPKKSKIWRYIAYALFVLIALEMIFAVIFTNRQR